MTAAIASTLRKTLASAAIAAAMVVVGTGAKRTIGINGLAAYY